MREENLLELILGAGRVANSPDTLNRFPCSASNLVIRLANRGAT